MISPSYNEDFNFILQNNPQDYDSKMQYKRTYLERKNLQKAKIGDIIPYQGKINLIFKVIKKGYTRKIKKNGTHVSECLVADDTGSILLTVWDEDIEMLEVGEYFSLSDGYATIHRNKLVLNKKRYGEIEPYPDQGFDVNTDNNLSKKIYDQTMTLLNSKNLTPEMVTKGINIGQDNVKIVGMNS